MKQADARNYEAVAAIAATGVDFPNRTIYLCGVVDDAMALRFMVSFQKLDATPGKILLVLCSEGGSEPAGYTIYDLLVTARNQVNIDCYGSALSIAAMILQAGAVRRLAPECRFMFHAGQVHLDGSVDTRTLAAVGKEIERYNTRYKEILGSRCVLAPEQLERAFQAEKYFSAEAAVEAGFADAVIDRPSPPRQKPPKKAASKKRKSK